LLRARILARLGRRRDAARDASAACALAPEDPRGHDFVATLAFEAGRYADAENAWKVALRLDPTNAGLLNNVGAALDRQGRKDEAREAFRRAIGMCPSLALPKRNLHANLQTPMKMAGLAASVVALAVYKLSSDSWFTWFTGSTEPSPSERAVERFVSSCLRAGMALCAAVLFLWVWRKRAMRRRQAEIEAHDPQLAKIYLQVDTDPYIGRPDLFPERQA
jgi:tetratricopeptide (TPR) repeat protein